MPRPSSLRKGLRSGGKSLGGMPLTTAVPAMVMFRLCPFCGGVHSSPYVDELEAAVMACRERAAPTERGSVDAWKDLDTWPVPADVEAFCGP